jgi:hypothetical protein
VFYIEICRDCREFRPAVGVLRGRKLREKRPSQHHAALLVPSIPARPAPKPDSDIDHTSLRGDKPSAARSFSLREASPPFMVKHEKERVIQDETLLFAPN